MMLSIGIKKHWALLIMCLSLWACVAQAKLPEWVSNPEADNKQYIFGIGVGADFETAKLAAQADIASKIEVTVSSQTALHQFKIGEKYSEEFSKQVVASVSDLPLGQLQLLKSTTTKNDVWVLYGLNRHKFQAYQKSRLLVDDREVQRLMGQFNAATVLQRWPLTAPIKAEISNARARISAMVALTQFNSRPYENRYGTYLDTLAKAESETLLLVSAKGNPDEQALAGSLADLAQQEGLYSTTIEGEGSPNGVLTVSSQLNAAAQGEAFETRVTVMLVLEDNKQQVLASREFYGSGRSYTNQADATRRAYQSIANRLRRDGLVKALNLTGVE